MSEFKAQKVISTLPDPLEADTVYLLRVGEGFDMFATDTTGAIAYKINPSDIVDVGGVDISAPSDGDVLVYNASSGVWENKPKKTQLPAGMMSDVISDWLTVDDGVIPFQSGIIERGGVVFNASADLGGTGEIGPALIVPKAGLYSITLQLGWTVTDVNDGDGVIFEIQKNGLGTDAIPTNEARIITTLGTAGGNEMTVTSTVIAELQPSDTVYARVTSLDSSAAEVDYGHMSLHLLDED